MELTERHQEYWRRNLKLTLVLVAIWTAATFVMSYFARELAAIDFFGWPLSFYMGAQGTLIVFLVINFVYARRMERLDEEYDVAEGED